MARRHRRHRQPRSCAPELLRLPQPRLSRGRAARRGPGPARRGRRRHRRTSLRRPRADRGTTASPSASSPPRPSPRRTSPTGWSGGRHQHPQLRADRALGARRRRRTQGRPLDRAADPRVPRAAQGERTVADAARPRRARRPDPTRREASHERPRRGGLPQVRSGSLLERLALDADGVTKLIDDVAGQRARQRGDRHRDLQPARGVRRRRPLPRQRRGGLAAARRAGR